MFTRLIVLCFVIVIGFGIYSLSQMNAPLPAPIVEVTAVPTPTPLPAISAIQKITTIGRGNIQNTAWQPHGDLLLVNTKLGAWFYTDMLADVVHLPEAEIASFSPNGRQIVAADSQQNIILWDTTTFKPTHILYRHNSPLVALVWSPAGDYLASMEENGIVILYDLKAQTLRVLYQFQQTPPDASGNLAWNPSGTHLAGTMFNEMRIWNLAGQTVLSFPNVWHNIAWQNDTRLLTWYFSDDGAAQLWDTTTGTFEDAQKLIGFSPAFSADGASFAVGGYRGAEIINMVDGTTKKVGSGVALEASWQPKGKLLAFSNDNIGIRAIENASSQILIAEPGGTVLRSLHVPMQFVWKLAWHQDNNRLAIVGDNLIMTWQVQTGIVSNLKSDHALVEYQPMMSWHPFLDVVALADRQGTIRLWDASRKLWLSTLEGLNAPILKLVWHPRGDFLAAIPKNSTINDPSLNRVVVWDMRQLAGKMLPAAMIQHDSELTDIAWKPDGTQLATVEKESIARFWNTQTFALSQKWNLRESCAAVGNCSTTSNFQTFFVGWSPDGQLLTTGSFLGDVDSGQNILFHGLGESQGMFWTPDNDLLGIRFINQDNPILVIDTLYGAVASPLITLSGLKAPFYHGGYEVLFNADTSAIAAIDASKSGMVWSLPDGTPRFAFYNAESVVWNQQGTQLWVLSVNGDDRLLDAQTGNVLITANFTGENPQWNAQGNFIADAHDGIVEIWQWHYVPS